MKNKILYILIIIISLFIVSWFFFTDWMIWHRMDWSIPIYSDSLKEFLTWNLYKWRIQDLWYQKVFYTNFELLESLVWLLWYSWIDPKLVPILLIFLSICISWISFIFFLNVLNNLLLKNKLTWFAIFMWWFFYSTSYAMFNQLLGGNWWITISWAFFPFLIGYLLKYIYLGQKRYLILSVLFLSLSIAQVHYIFYIFITILFYLFAVKFRKDILYKIIQFWILWIIINMFWIIDLISILWNQTSEIIQKATETNFLWSLHYWNNSIIHAFTLTWWWTNHLEINLQSFFWISSFIFFSLSIISIFLYYKEKYIRNIILLIFIYIFFFVFIFTWYREPFWLIKSYIFDLPWMTFFKSPQHNLFIISFFIWIILSLSISKITNNNYKKILLITFYIWLSYNFFPWNFINNFNYYEQSKIIENWTNLLKDDKNLYRVMFLPSAVAPYIPENNFYPKVWADLDTFFFIKPTFHTEWTDENNIKQIIEKKVYNNNFKENDLLKLNIRYVFLRNDRMHWNVNYATDYWNWSDKNETYNRLFKILSSNNYLKIVENFKYNWFSYSIWKVNTNSSLLNSNNLSFQKQNPTKYKLNIKNISTFQDLSFFQSFHKEWKLYLKPNENALWCKPLEIYNNGWKNITECEHKQEFFQWEELSYLYKKSLFEESHNLVYDYANWWNISKNEIIKYVDENYSKELEKEWYPKQIANGKLDYKYYILNSDGSIDVELTLYFKPQSYFYLGLIISGTTFIILVW